MEPNPYEPPHEEGPLTAGKAAKRGLGVAAIVLLTPVAVGVALGASCAATYAVVGIASIGGLSTEAVVVAMLVLFVVPPGMVLTAMIRWAIRTHRQARIAEGKEPKPEESQPKRPMTLLEKLVQFPTISSLVLQVLTVTIISVLFFTWLVYIIMQGQNR